MKQKYFCLVMQFLLISGICSVPVRAQNPDVSLSEILQAVQKNVDFLKEQIINFTCKEEITIEEFNYKGKIKKTTNIISDYRAFPEMAKSEQASLIVPGILREERETLSVKENGKAKKVKNFTEPVYLSGRDDFTELFVWFDKQNEEYFDYKLNGVEKVNERNTYVITIKQKEKESGKIGNWRWNNLIYEGIAWIDAETMEVIQINRGVVGVKFISRKLFTASQITKHFRTRYEYDKVKIGDQLLTLPAAKTVEVFSGRHTIWIGSGVPPEVDLEKGIELFRTNVGGHFGESMRRDTTYKYKYSNHKAFSVDTNVFTVDTEIRYGATDE
jgi:hypothetical protein